MKKVIVFFFAGIVLSGCGSPIPPATKERVEECKQQTNELGRYGSPGDGVYSFSYASWVGPCIGSVYEETGSDMVRPTLLSLTFDDLYTGGVTTVRWRGGKITSVEYER